jgi:hypothetical protein
MSETLSGAFKFQLNDARNANVLAKEEARRLHYTSESSFGVDKSWRELAGIPLVELHC